MLIKLDDVWAYPQSKAELPFVVIDLRVFLHKSFPAYFQASKAMLGGKDEAFLSTTMQAIWALILNQPMPALTTEPLQLLIVDDFKSPDSTYWRSKYYPSYKSNRTIEADRDSSYSIMLQAAYEYIARANLPLLRQESFEADDIAAMVAKLWPAKRELILATLDGDWMQLVDDRRKILWYNTLNNGTDRLRSEYEVLLYFNQWGQAITKPTDIAKHKQIYGDVSDNILPADAPLGIIDLHKPLLEPVCPIELLLLLEEPKANTSCKAYNAGKKWLLKNGLGSIIEASANW